MELDRNFNRKFNGNLVQEFNRKINNNFNEEGEYEEKR